MAVNGSGPSTRSTRSSRSGAVSNEVVAESSSKNKGKGKAAKNATGPKVTPAKIEQERTALLSEKQTELVAVLDRHDNLIREQFHMENFGMMVDYDPEVAKQDESQVFQNYKSRHDLLESAAPIAISPRKTRSSHAGILNIAGSSSSAPAAGPSNSISASLRSSSKLPPKGPVKSKSVVAPSTRPKGGIIAESPVPRSKIIVPSTGAKGKKKAVEDSDREPKIVLPAITRGKGKEKEKKEVDSAERGRKIMVVSRTRSVKGKEKAVDEVETEPPDSISTALTRGRTSSTSAVDRKLRKRPGEAPDSVELVTKPEALSRPRKRRKIDADSGTVEDNSVAQAIQEVTSISAPVNGRVLRGRNRLMEPAEPPSQDPSNETQNSPVGGESSTAPAGRVMPRRTAAHRPQVPLPPLPHRRTVVAPPSPIKRIKLVVRRPPPRNLSHPKQRPPPPQFNSSLSAFLGSWNEIADQTFLADGQQADSSGDAEMLKVAEKEAAIRERVEQMKRAGQWFGSDSFRESRFNAAHLAGKSGSATPLDGTTSGGAAIGIVDATNSGDLWAAVVHSVIDYGRKTHAHSSSSSISKTSKTRGALVAAQVASKIQGYWDGEAAKLEKGRIIEERRLKALAKSVMKDVVGEWKKALFHIREQERLKLEAEELKRGQTHLDAILDQSGIILETQQGDLSRGVGVGRSRSSSVSASVMRWGEEGDEDDREDEDEDEEEGEEEGEGRDEHDNASARGDETGADDELPAGEQEEEEEEEADAGVDAVSQPDLDTKSEVDDEQAGEATSAHLLGGYLQTPKSTSSALSAPCTPVFRCREISTLPDTPADAGEREEEEEDDDMSAAAVEDMMREPFSSPIKPFDPFPSNAADVTEQILPSADEENTEPAHRPSSQHSPLDSVDDAVSVANMGTKSSPIAQQSGVDNDTPPVPASPVESHTATLAGEQDEEQEEDSDAEDERPPEPEIPPYLRPYAVAPVEWDLNKRVTPPLLLRGLLRPYQQSGLEWLASLHANNLNGILADEMGLGKTIQTIALLAHLACDRGIWGPHLIIVPTSVLLNWEMEFKKFLPGFRVLSYHGSTKRRKELRQGWNEKHRFNVCITSYTLASRDAIVLKRKPWYYMILDEAHMIKNFKSQRWNTLLLFRSFRRLLLTGTPLQNNLTELWALLQFLMSGSDFVNLKEFGDWFSNPLEKAIEAGNAMDEDTMQRVTKLHTVLRPYLLRRLKRDVEKELPSKYEHLVLCPLSKRQRFLYDEFMSRAHTRDALQSGIYQKIANILMQLRKVCNHPDLFEVRPIVTSFSMERSAVADFEIKELLLRRRLLDDSEQTLDLDLLGLRFIDRQDTSSTVAQETRRLDGTTRLPYISDFIGASPPKDTRTISGWRAYNEYQQRAAIISRWAHIGYVNRLRCNSSPIYSSETLRLVQLHQRIAPLSAVDTRFEHLNTVYRVNAAVKSFSTRADEMASIVDRFAFVTPPVVALDLPRIALAGYEQPLLAAAPSNFDAILHRASVKLQIAFPDPSLLQYDCGKLQQLTRLLREKKAGGHRVLIFTQMTKILDILEIYLNFHGYLYLRLDGATRIEDRQYITERFNADARVFCFIASSRSGGVGINLTGADTVIFYDSDFNPQMDRQCEDRAHRIGQIRDVHIYRFVSSHTVEEAMLRKANQKRSLDDLVIQKGEFDWRSLFADDGSGTFALEKALEEFDDTEDAHAAVVAAREEVALQGQDTADFVDGEGEGAVTPNPNLNAPPTQSAEPEAEEPEEEEGGSVADYMIAFVQRDAEFFRDWKL
ncbi:helicase SWR1 [Favolaschia claudopus]|uniref:Helicase SWR1 n=1 Tax=Favolaschia claudopus TaxID=2862362 RepID=A0AAW0E0P0_9AGAR